MTDEEQKLWDQIAMSIWLKGEFDVDPFEEADRFIAQRRAYLEDKT